MSQCTAKVSRAGYVYALATAVAVGLFPVFGKLLLVNTKPLTISAIGFLVSGLILFPGKYGRFPNRESAPWIVATGFLGAALAPALYLLGVNQTSAVNSALLSNGEVFFTGMIAYVIFRERLKRVQLFESVFVVLGIVVVSTNLNFSGVGLLGSFAGNVLIIGSGLVWAIDNNLIRVTSQKFGTYFVAKFRNIFGGGMLLGFILATSSVSVSPSAVPLLLLYAGDVALSSLTFMAALVRIGAVRTLLVFSTSSIFGSLFSIVILHEGLSYVQGLGGSLIILGVYLIQRSEE